MLRLTGTGGLALAWRTHAPATAGEVAPYRFAYLPESRMAAVRSAYGGYLHERAMRSAPDVKLAPPAGRGCLLCGVGTVAVPAASVARMGRVAMLAATWRSLSTTVTELGRTSPDRANGHLCPMCAEAFESVGAVGPGLLARALVAHLRSTGAEQVAKAVEYADTDDRIRLVGWGALIGDPPPNERPWEHLDLSGLVSE